MPIKDVGLLLGAAVYRQPVDRVGLAWQIAPIQQPPADPDRDQRVIATGELITEMRRSGKPASEVGLTEDMLQQYQRDWNQLQQPPLVIPPDLDEALTTLFTLGLIAPVPSPNTDDKTPHYLVRRWTAAALTKPHRSQRADRSPPPSRPILAMACRRLAPRPHHRHPATR
ncbi:MAG: hypothetical protein M3460_12030 [Actinomycetota bacterium]|nr:hypothetical protein [Actinomycetota bacterium]